MSGGVNTTTDYSGRINYWALGAKETNRDTAEPSWTMQGKVGGGYEFDGVNDTLQCKGCANTGTATGSLSIEAWIRLNDTSISIETIAERNNNWLLSAATNTIVLYLFDGGGAYHNQWTTTTTLTQQAWTHVVATVNSSDTNSAFGKYL